MTEQKTINVGLISVGWMGKVHTRAYSAVPQLYPELGVKTRLLQAADTSHERVKYAIDVLGYETGTSTIVMSSRTLTSTSFRFALPTSSMQRWVKQRLRLASHSGSKSL